jgi:tetratricopeptide (TPR) repeat protein/predicted Ser/Thr protein kinase
MVSKSSFTSKLTRDPRQKAELYSREGKKQKAAEMFAKAGDYRQAARLAGEVGDERLAVECSLLAAFGTADPGALPPLDAGPAKAASAVSPEASRQPPPVQLALTPLAAAERLANAGHHDLAIGLFELMKAYRRAAASALGLGQAARAGRLYERGRSFFDAAVQYENAELLEDAARVLEQERKRLGGGEAATRADPVVQEQLSRIDLRRAEVLRKLGKGAEATALLRDVRPTQQTVRLLEASGKMREAIETALGMGDAEAAVRLLQRAPDIDRKLAAETYLRCGHALEAGNLFAGLGMSKEAAGAYETGGDWAKAGSRWETAQEQDKAAEAYLRARRPRDAGRCYAAAGKHQLAAGAYSRAGDHGAAAGLYLKGRLRVAAATELLSAGDKEQATRVLLQAAAGGQEQEAATLLLAPLLLAQGQAEDALQRLRQMPPERPSAVRGAAGNSERAHVVRERLYWMGRAYEQLEKLDPAANCYRELADPTIDHRDSIARLAEIRGRLRLAAATPSMPTLGVTAMQPVPTAAMPPTLPTLPAPPAAAQTATRLTGAVNLSVMTTALTITPPTLSAPSAHSAAPDHGAARATAMDRSASAGRDADSAPAASATGGPGRGGPGGSAGSGIAGGPGGLGGPGGAGANMQPASGRPPVGTLSIGQVLAGRFQILAELGQGGMGRVYRAHDFELGEEVAIKMLLGQRDDGSVDAERLLREVQICRKITHPNVVRVFDLGRHQGWIFIIMELLEGQTLADLIDSGTRPPLAQVRTILSEIASGLQEAHILGVVHRDLKPENVILTATRLKILDFGIARMSGFDKRLTQVGFALGSPLYMSPEQIQGIAIDSRSDLYSLGVLAFALLTGREPFDGTNSTAIAIQHLQQPPPDLRSLRPELPDGWSELVAKLLAKRPEDRFQSAQDVIGALTTLAAE